MSFRNGSDDYVNLCSLFVGPSEPRRLSVKTVMSTKVVLEWEIPAITNGQIKKYKVWYKTVGQGNTRACMPGVLIILILYLSCTVLSNKQSTLNRKWFANKQAVMLRLPDLCFPHFFIKMYFSFLSKDKPLYSKTWV